MRIVQTRSELVRGPAWVGRLALGIIAGSLGVSAATALRAVAADSVQRHPATAQIRFAGTSTLHDFGGQLPAQPFLLTLSNGTWSGSADVLAVLMATDNLKRDRKMHEMLRTNDYPRLHGAVAGAPIPAPGSVSTNAALALKIRGVLQNLNVRVGKWQETGDAIRFHAEWELSLKQYGLKPPSVAGVIRVGDTVKLEADVTAKKSVPASSPGTIAPIP